MNICSGPAPGETGVVSGGCLTGPLAASKMKIKYERTTIDEKSNGEDLIAPADTVEKIETIRRSKFLDITRQKKIGQKETVVQFRFQCDEYPCIDSKFPELEAATAEYEENIAELIEEAASEFYANKVGGSDMKPKYTKRLAMAKQGIPIEVQRRIRSSFTLKNMRGSNKSTPVKKKERMKTNSMKVQRELSREKRKIERQERKQEKIRKKEEFKIQRELSRIKRKIERQERKQEKLIKKEEVKELKKQKKLQNRVEVRKVKKQLLEEKKSMRQTVKDNLKKNRNKEEKPGGRLKTKPLKKMKVKLLNLKTLKHMKTWKDMEDEMAMDISADINFPDVKHPCSVGNATGPLFFISSEPYREYYSNEEENLGELDEEGMRKCLELRMFGEELPAIERTLLPPRQGISDKKGSGGRNLYNNTYRQKEMEGMVEAILHEENFEIKDEYCEGEEDDEDVEEVLQDSEIEDSLEFGKDPSTEIKHSVILQEVGDTKVFIVSGLHPVQSEFTA